MRSCAWRCFRGRPSLILFVISAKNSGEGKKKKSKQETKTDGAVGTAQHKLHAEFRNLLRTVTTRASLWMDDNLRYLREFCHTVAAHTLKFPRLAGDDTNEFIIDNGEETVVELTDGYISAVAEGRSTLASVKHDHPVLAVLERETGYRDVMRHQATNNHQKVKLTHLTLMDGDNHQIHARMATELTDKGRALQRGDIIRLDLFTELTYRVNAQSPNMPALFILGYSIVGHKPVPAKEDIGERPTYKPTLSNLLDDGDKTSFRTPDPLKEDPPACTYEKRLCRKFGINFIGRCICEQIPVAERDLTTITEDCHLIGKPLSEINENKPKRLMLYWWYATNVYSIRGKGHRGRLPVCLEYAIKKAYPEKYSEDWTGYKSGKKKAGPEDDSYYW